MRYIISLVIVALVGSSALAQSTDANALPARFAPLLKNEHLRLLRVLGTPEMQVSFASTSSFSADGKQAVYYEDLSTGDENHPILRGRLHVWDVAGKKWPREIELAGKSVYAIALSADGRLAAMSGLANVEKQAKPRAFVGVFDIAIGQFRHSMTTETPASSLILEADGATVIGGALSDLKRWNLKSGKETAAYKTDAPANVLALAPSTKPGQFIAGYETGVVRLWDANAARVVREYAAVKGLGLPAHVAVSQDGTRLVVGDFQGVIRVLELATGKEVARFSPDPSDGERFTTALALSGETLTVNWLKSSPVPDDASASILVAFDLKTKKQRWSLPVPYRGRPAVRLTNDSLQIGGGPNRYDEYDTATGKHLASFGAHRSPVSSLLVGPRGFIHSAGAEPKVNIWSNIGLTKTIAGLPAAVTALAASRDGKSWSLACANGDIRLIPTDDSKPLAIATKQKSTITSLVYNVNGKWVYSACEDRTIKTWSTTDGAHLSTLEGHSEGVTAIAVSPDDRWLASGSNDATIRLWPIRAGKLDTDRDVIVLEGHSKGVTCLAFSADGKTLLTGSLDRSVKVWDWANAKCVRTIVGHKNWITAVLVLDPATVLTTSDDLTACIWNLETGKEIGQVDFGLVGDCPRSVTRSADGRVLFGTANWLIYEMELRLPQSK